MSLIPKSISDKIIPPININRAKIKKFEFVVCPITGRLATREIDTYDIEAEKQGKSVKKLLKDKRYQNRVMDIHDQESYAKDIVHQMNIDKRKEC